jgi:hypothetical protein
MALQLRLSLIFTKVALDLAELSLVNKRGYTRHSVSDFQSLLNFEPVRAEAILA